MRHLEAVAVHAVSPAVAGGTPHAFPQAVNAVDFLRPTDLLVRFGLHAAVAVRAEALLVAVRAERRLCAPLLLVTLHPRHWMRHRLHLGVAVTANLPICKLPPVLLVTANAELLNMAGYAVLFNRQRYRSMASPALLNVFKPPRVRSVAPYALLVRLRCGWSDRIRMAPNARIPRILRFVRLVAGAAWELHRRIPAKRYSPHPHSAVARQTRPPGWLKIRGFNQILVAG
jgi:hypothetical protein